MITYMFIKDELEEDFFDFIMVPLTILLDILFVFFQPIFYIIYKYKEL